MHIHEDHQTDTMEQTYARMVMYGLKGARPLPVDTDTNFNLAAVKACINYDVWQAEQQEEYRQARRDARNAERRAQRQIDDDQLEVAVFGMSFADYTRQCDLDQEVADQAMCMWPDDQPIISSDN